jgi:hypothetical protein
LVRTIQPLATRIFTVQLVLCAHALFE